ncbi:hypothetical protein D3C75_762370 [compost metagenome]
MAHHSQEFRLGFGGNLRFFLGLGQLSIYSFQLLCLLLQKHSLHLMFLGSKVHIDEAFNFGFQNLGNEGLDHIINSTSRITRKQMLRLFAVG